MPLLIGGAAINPQFAERISTNAELGEYKAGIYYCKDAFEGLMVMEQLVEEEKRKHLNSDFPAPPRLLANQSLN